MLWGHGCDVPRLDVLNTANLCPAVSVVGLFYLLTVMFGLELWSILDGQYTVNSGISGKIRSYVLFVVLTLVYSGLEFSRCQRCI